MFRIGATVRIAFGLACLTISVLLVIKTVGLTPDHRDAVVEGRVALAESLAVNYSLFATGENGRAMRAAVDTLVERNPDLVSAAVRDKDGNLLFQSEEHVLNWEPDAKDSSQVYVPIFRGEHPAGTVELKFHELSGEWLGDPFLQQALIIGALSMVAFTFYLRRMLRHLDPSKVVPQHVRDALDTFAEGLLLVDKSSTIVLSNKAFATKCGQAVEDLTGSKIDRLPWSRQEGDAGPFPWTVALQSGEEQSEVVLQLATVDQQMLTFKVNASPIFEVAGSTAVKGALASFSDITALEKNKSELMQMMQKLQTSRDEIRRQNDELQILATRDPLTSCLNRRSFFELFEKHWNDSQRNDRPLSCAMVDVDHFKSINDNHGHSMGDEVLRRVSATLRAGARETDLVCRYGGEEFCILMPGIGADDAWQAAEGHRRAIESLQFEEFTITASLGVSALSFGPPSREDLLDQADKCLYVAKRNGRNQVVRFDQTPEDLVVDEAAISRTPEEEAAPAPSESIPYSAVQALISTLSYRDPVTAEHSRRVADLCVAAGGDLLSSRDLYLLEIAALLHDIGKVGVPDAILLKPGALNDQEWKIMQAHTRIGVEIVRSTFASEELTGILEHYQDVRKSGPVGENAMPLPAKILKIADAFDSMTTDRIYRAGRTQEEAFEELRRCAGETFDPELVEHFINVCGGQNARGGSADLGNKQIELQIGIQIERIATLLDDEDLPGINVVAARLQSMATEVGAGPVASLAAEIRELAAGEEEFSELVTLVHQLLEMYRHSPQSANATPAGTMVL